MLIMHYWTVGLEVHRGELTHQGFQWHSILESNGDQDAERVDEPKQGRPSLGQLHEDLADLPGFCVEPDVQEAFVVTDLELVAT